MIFQNANSKNFRDTLSHSAKLPEIFDAKIKFLLSILQKFLMICLQKYSFEETKFSKGNTIFLQILFSDSAQLHEKPTTKIIGTEENFERNPDTVVDNFSRNSKTFRTSKNPVL